MDLRLELLRAITRSASDGTGTVRAAALKALSGAVEAAANHIVLVNRIIDIPGTGARGSYSEEIFRALRTTIHACSDSKLLVSAGITACPYCILKIYYRRFGFKLLRRFVLSSKYV